VKYTPDLRYSWDNGLALTTYLDGFKHGRIRGSRCSKCGRLMIPPRSFCELCNLQLVGDYFDLADTGTVQTFTLSHVNWDSAPLPKGKVNVFAVIAIDGAALEMGLCHLLGEVKPGDVKIGMRVQAVWKSEKERTGTVTDIKYFKPVKGAVKAAAPVQIKPVELDSESARSFKGKIPMSYVYTAGLGGSKFYEDLAKGKLTGTWCPHCEALHVPPAAFCEFGMIPLDPIKDARPVEAKDGIVVAATVVCEDRSGHPLECPEVIVQVAFPGTVGTLFGKLLFTGEEELGVGMTVELVKTQKNAGPEQICFRPKG
jgi:uncharacterized OB-fold protein